MENAPEVPVNPPTATPDPIFTSTPDPIPDTPPTSPQPKRNLLSILPIVGAVLALLGASLFAYRFFQKPTVISENENIADDALNPPKPSPELIVDEMEEWETYANSELGFSLIHPPTWDGIENLENSCNLIRFIKGEEADAALSAKEYVRNYYGFIDGYIDELESHLSEDFLIKFVNIPSENFFIAGPQGEGEINNIFIKNRKDYLHISVTYSGSLPTTDYCKQTLDEYKEILSTFEFTDSPSQTKNWDSYTNTKYRYQLEYPSDWKIAEETVDGNQANLTSDTVLVFSPQANPDNTFYTGIRIEYTGMLAHTNNLERIELPHIPETTVYKQDTMHGENYYINLPDTDSFLYITGTTGYTSDEEMNQTLNKIFDTFSFIK